MSFVRLVWEFLTILALFFALGETAESKTLKVAIIDTGRPIDEHLPSCGSADFTGATPFDEHGHSTNVSNLIHKHADGANYCQYSIKFWTKEESKKLKSLELPIALAILLEVDVINISAGGYQKGPKECAMVKLALDKGIKIVAAAGNEGKILEKEPFYPAYCDPRVQVVSCTNFKKANKGKKVKHKYPCVNVGSPMMTGTSQATAIHTGKLLKKLNDKEK